MMMGWSWSLNPLQSLKNFKLKTKLFNFLVGPEIKARNRTRLTPGHTRSSVLRTRESLLRRLVRR